MSGISFKIGTTLYLTTATHKYKFLVGEVTASQTFVGSTHSIKTIQERALIERTFTTEKSPVSLEFSIYLGAGEPEKALANWFDIPFISGTSHAIPTYIDISAIPSTYDVYIVSGNNSTYKVSSAVAENLSFTISHREILAAKITATGSDLEDITDDVVEMGVFNGLTEVSQVSSGFRHEDVVITNFNNILGVTLEITRGVSWLNQKSVFDIGNIYKVSKPSIDKLAIAGTITQTKINNNNPTFSLDSPVNIFYGPSFNAELKSCSITERLDLGDYHRIVTDFVLLPSSVDSTIKF